MTKALTLSVKELELSYSTEPQCGTEDAELYISELEREISRGKTLGYSSLGKLLDKAFPELSWYPRYRKSPFSI